MRFSVSIPNFGDFADPEAVAVLAQAVEHAGWDALFVWDHMVHEKRLAREIADPWILLTAAAMVTSRIKLGTMVTPVARRRPQKLAREVTTLDRLTGGRMILGVGLGDPVDDEYGAFGEPTDRRELAARLDEGLEVLDRLWSGERTTYEGTYLTVRDVVFRPTPVQRPRVPIWVGGRWPNKAPMRRAARWDGAVPIMAGAWQAELPVLAEVQAMGAYLRQARRDAGRAEEPFDVVIGGSSPDGTWPLLADLATEGVTWWDERMPFGELLDTADPIRRRVDQGPPGLPAD
ncbi:LLM class flavin-dependent oxidoreductase [Actinocrispum wychmicini]|uniref:Luciferase-like monooxygenase n=1 Tax=Actinocrispum wychmicini TaxID=1213861 RepID=A0A4R2K6N0_9PSEU|nr:LLM class flavin-dependent oxidoreductase [Actinocrispum wychmicini]TCO65579.1 luciferase-like monooxygenase [Actinocrispum wychmicini]